MNTSIEIHERLLFSIYIQLTGDERCSRAGQHWIDIGFQNEDPQTDIRGSGILGLIQLLYFTEVYNELAWRYLHHSQIPDSKFPFSVKWFEFTTLTLKILRSGKLFKTWNDKGNVDIVWNDLYSAAIWLFMWRYIQTQSNIRHMNDLNNQVFEYVEKNPELVVKQFKDYIDSQKEKEDKFQVQEFPNYDMQTNHNQDDEEDEDNNYSKNTRQNKYAM